MTREHIDEIPSIIEDFGVTSFKIFMFYGSHGLHGKSADQSSFLMIPPGSVTTLPTSSSSCAASKRRVRNSRTRRTTSR